MAAERIFDEVDVQELLEQNAAPSLRSPKRCLDPRRCVLGVDATRALLGVHQGLSPSSRFFLNDRGEPYKPTERKNKPGSYQPRSMLEQLKRMIDRTILYGATPASYRDSFIKGMFDNGAGWSDLKKVTGIKQKRTLEKKVRPHER